MRSLSSVRKIVPDFRRYSVLVHNSDGNAVFANSIAESIAFSAYTEFIPPQVREIESGRRSAARLEAAETLQRLTHIAGEMEEECRKLTAAYRHEKASEICRQIRELTGIEVSEN